MSVSLSLLLLLVSLMVGIAGVWQWSRGSAQRAEAIARSRPVAGEAGLTRFRRNLDRRLGATVVGAELESRLQSAGLGLGMSDFILLALAAALGAYLAARLILPPSFALIAGAVMLYGAVVFLERQRAKRREAFVAQLPELARVLSNASGAGLALPSAVGMAATELDEPASSTLGRVVEELRLGQPIDAALEHLERQMPSREVAVLVSTLVIQQRTGGDVVKALREMSDTLEARKDLRREVKTLLASAVATSYMVFALGLGSLLLMNAISPGVIAAMTRSTVGRIAFVAGLTLYGLGFLLIRRTTRIET